MVVPGSRRRGPEVRGQGKQRSAHWVDRDDRTTTDDLFLADLRRDTVPRHPDIPVFITSDASRKTTVDRIPSGSKPASRPKEDPALMFIDAQFWPFLMAITLLSLSPGV